MTNDEDILRFYGRRKGKKLRDRRQDAYENVLPEITITPDSLKTEKLPDNLCLEIGFGDGKHLLHQAMQNPDMNYIGCEPFINGIALLCADIRDNNIKNIRIWPDDARLLMTALPDACLDKCYLLNSDPWPKNRHAKRRFVQKETLDELHRLLKPGALFRMSSDHRGLVAWQLEKTYFHGGFEWMAECAADWRDRPADLPETRYQNKGADQGRPTVFLDFKKRLHCNQIKH